MIIGIPKEILPGEIRVAAIPATVKELVRLGLTIHIEKDAGKASGYADADYEEAGAVFVDHSDALYAESDLVAKVSQPDENEILQMKPDTILVSFFQPTKELARVQLLTKQGITGFSMHLIPRTTLAQKMDALSSQSNIAGYKAVIIGADHINVYMPLLMTAAGTIQPARVLVLGAGVAGLQAIATARRLGAQVEAFDVRPEVKEQVESLGAKFVEVEKTADEGVGTGGYAAETSEEYKKKQSLLVKDRISRSDLVITTALIPGRPAPLLIPRDMVDGMKPGAVIMDLAAENGGNCELTEPGEIINYRNVTIDGRENLAQTMPRHASQLYAKNIGAFLTYLCPDGALNLNLEDEIINGALFTHQGKVTHDQTREIMKREGF